MRADRPHEPHSADDPGDGVDGVRDGSDGSRSAAARSESHQALPPALQRVSMRDDKSFPYILICRDHPAPADDEASRRAKSQGRLFRAVRVGRQRSAARSTCCSGRFFCARAPTASTRAARGRACSIRSNAARRRARARSALEEYDGLVDEAERFLRGEKPDGAPHVPGADGRRPPTSSSSRRPRDTATGCGRSRTSRRISRSIRKASRKPTCSPPIRTAGRRASRCSSSARAKTGAIAPIIPKADRSLNVEEVLESFIAQFYDDKPVPRLILLSHDIPSRGPSRRSLIDEGGAQGRNPRALARHKVDDRRACARRMRARRLGRKLAESSSQARLLEGVAERFGLQFRAAPDRSVRQQPHRRHERRWRDDRARARKGSSKGSTGSSTSSLRIRRLETITR